MAASIDAMSPNEQALCTRAACWIEKYDVNSGQRQRYFPDQWIVASQSRNKVFVNVDDMQGCGDDVRFIGYSDNKTHFIGVLFPAGKNIQEAEFIYNEKPANRHPELPKVKRDMVIGTGLGGNHFNTYLRAVGQRRPHVGSQIADASGNLSVDILRQISPMYARAVQQGVPCTVLSAKMLTEEPGAANDIQAAENGTRAVGKLESCIQMVRKACARIEDPSLFDDGAKKVLVAQLQQEAPHLREHIEGYVIGASKLGGAGSAHVSKLAERCGRYLRRGRRVEGALWKTVCEAETKYV